MTSLAARSDGELVALMRSGQGDALAEIARRHRTMMLAVARPLLAGTAYDAEDAVQDALLRAQRALPRARGPIVLRAWLATVVRNRAIDLRRRRDALTGELPETLAASGDVAELVARREQVRSTVQALHALPDRQRLALVSHAFEGRSHREIAGGLGTSETAVKQLVRRARQGLAVAA